VIKIIHAAALAIFLAGAQGALADECGDTVRDYNSVLSHLTDAMEHFSACVADSKGLKDCAKEFGELRSAYRQFMSVVEIYSKECESHG
jgi:hypothetical protein